MPLTPGTRLGAYEVLSPLGAGGMGEVYRAHDSKLNRDVALKILPAEVDADPDRLARFGREAHVLASLNHPNIAAIYGFEDAGPHHALVLELVEGPTLADVIAQRALLWHEVLPLARQLADALEAAHEQGVIHRDLKPANIKVRPDGTVKVLDFGLAKALEPAGSAIAARGGMTASPTITTPVMTGVGMLLGTAAYMSPEQAKGRPADKRSDIWAFGCVLYEVVTGKRAFDGEDVADTLANVLKTEPDWKALPSDVPSPIAILLERCLQKQRNERVGDVSTLKFVLNEPALLRQAPQSVRTRWSLVPVAAAAIVGALAGIAALRSLTSPNSASTPVTRFTVTLGRNSQFTAPGRHVLALSPDGRWLAYVANGQLYVRSLDHVEATPVRGTTSRLGGSFGRSPFFSPDGKWLGFWQEGKLKKVLVDGGTPADICSADNPYGATWSDDNTIVFGEGARGILRVPADGGQPEIIVPDPGGLAHGPQILPGGRTVLFTLLPQGSSWDDAQIVVQSLDNGRREVLIRGGTDARFLPTGHLVYVSQGTLFAVSFDPTTSKVSGAPVGVVDQIAQSPSQTGAAHYSISRSGSLAYVSGTFRPAVTQRLAWLDRQGHETPIKAPVRAYLYPRVSPDGTRIAVSVRDKDEGIWIWDIARETFAPLTLERGRHLFPVWTPDSRRIAFAFAAAGDPNVWWQSADGTGTAERLTQSPTAQLPTSFSSDGSRLLMYDPNFTRMLVLQVNGDRRVDTLLRKTGGTHRNGELSPDGRWMAYETDESGERQVVVRPYPDVEGGRWQVSVEGGQQPMWSHDGRELFYVANGGGLMRLPVAPTLGWSASTPVKLLDGPYTWSIPNIIGRQFDATPKGDRFLVLKPEAATEREAAPDTIVMVQNWFSELKQRVTP